MDSSSDEEKPAPKNNRKKTQITRDEETAKSLKGDAFEEDKEEEEGKEEIEKDEQPKKRRKVEEDDWRSGRVRNAERIFAEKINPETGGTFYYVKWKNLPYSESTWEARSIVKSYFPTYLEEYIARKKSKSNPKNYKQAVKIIKKKFRPMKEQPDYIGDEKLRLRDYQLDGVNFLLDAWHKGNSMILADEMGLGKTIQTITFLKYLFHNYKFKGPMLISVPLSTLAAWHKEFQMWAPEMNVIAYIGDGKSRDIIREYEIEDRETGELIFNVLLTTYEMVGKDRNFFVDIAWSNIVIDEAHRLKNQNSLLYKVLVEIESHHRLLLTGTPLQNSLKELWCLLNYISIPDLDAWHVFEENYGSKEEKELGYIKLHTLLKPYIIRTSYFSQGLIKVNEGLLEHITNMIDDKKKDLECPVCFETAETPIYQCTGSHLICKHCLPNLKICPQCRTKYPKTPFRNRFAEKMEEETKKLSGERKALLEGI